MVETLTKATSFGLKLTLKQFAKNHSLGIKLYGKRPTEKDCIAIGLKFIKSDALYRYILERFNFLFLPESEPSTRELNLLQSIVFVFQQFK